MDGVNVIQKPVPSTFRATVSLSLTLEEMKLPLSEVLNGMNATKHSIGTTVPSTIDDLRENDPPLTKEKYIQQEDSYTNRLNCIECALILLQGKAEIDPIDDRGYTPLCSAAEAGNTALVRVLASYGANVNHRYNNGPSPIYLAMKNIKTDTVLALLDLGAVLRDVEVFRLAKREGVQVLELLKLAGANFRIKDRNRSTLLHHAAWAGNDAVVAWLIDSGFIDVNAEACGHCTPLHWAAGDGHVSTVKLLIERGASINTSDSCGQTALKLALDWGYLDVVQYLQSVGAQFSCKEIQGMRGTQ